MARDKEISNDLLGLCRSLVATTSETEYKDACIELCRSYFHNKYQKRTDINFDEIKIWGAPHDINALRYGNLYSYVLAEGHAVSYADWTYNQEVCINNYIYMWSEILEKGYQLKDGERQFKETDTIEVTTAEEEKAKEAIRRADEKKRMARKNWEMIKEEAKRALKLSDDDVNAMSKKELYELHETYIKTKPKDYPS